MPGRMLQDLHKVIRMAGDFDLATDLPNLIDDTHRRLFDRDIQTYVVLHAALLPLMPDAILHEPRCTTSLRRRASSWNGKALAAGRISHLNNRAENSHLPFRRRERAMQGFRSPRYLQRFVSVFSAVRNLFVPPRSHSSARATHLHRLNAMAEWKSAASVRLKLSCGRIYLNASDAA